MKKALSFKAVGIILVAALVSFIVATLSVPMRPGTNPEGYTYTAQKEQSVYDRVMASGKIRAGYIIYPPAFEKDPNTGEVTGIFADALEKAAHNLNLEVEYTEQADWGTMIEGLKADRYDIVVAPIWPNAARGAQADFTVPLYYSVIYAYKQPSNDKIQSIEDMNNPEVTISVIDGEISSFMAKQQFPQASTIAVAQSGHISDAILDVTTGKADVVFLEPHVAVDFLANNPGALEQIADDRPISAYPNAYMIDKGEIEFKLTLDTALQELILQNYVNDLVRGYEDFPNSFMPVALPFEMAQ